MQDLKILDNGLLLSCAYDGKIICWHYNEDIKHGEILKENQQLRCMDAVTESGTLLIGTNTFTILTQQITEWINFRSDEFMPIEGESVMEEQKDYAEDDYDSEIGGYRRRDGEAYDILEGQTLDEALDEIYANNSKGALAMLQEQERRIL